MSKVVSTHTLQRLKREGRKIVADRLRLFNGPDLDNAHVDLILVGDSLAMVALGQRTTHAAVTMEEMLHHARAVTRGVKTALVVADLPFMSYQVDITQAIANAGRFIDRISGSCSEAGRRYKTQH